MKKSIFYIFVVLMALSLTLGAVSAEDAAADAPVAADDAVAVEAAPADEGNAAGGDGVSAATVEELDIPVADVAVGVEVFEETEYGIVWSVVAANYGPDIAYDTDVRVAGSDNLYLYDYALTDGFFLPELGDWYVGDMLPGTYEVLFLETLKVDAILDEGNGPYYVEALITTSSFDPDLSNNYDIAWTGLDAAAGDASEETLPETGNPLAMALLALLAIGIGGIKRRF